MSLFSLAPYGLMVAMALGSSSNEAWGQTLLSLLPNESPALSKAVEAAWIQSGASYYENGTRQYLEQRFKATPIAKPLGTGTYLYHSYQSETINWHYYGLSGALARKSARIQVTIHLY